jgi:catechol 2,3-dioxygenase-like lactoylglutathione lyase family enzyme
MQGGAAAALLEIPEVQLQAVYLERDGTCLELLAFPHPGTQDEAAPRPMNRLGLTHLSFEVDDLGAAAQRVQDAGGRIHEPSRIPVALFVLDPDGTRIELVQRPPECA